MKRLVLLFVLPLALADGGCPPGAFISLSGDKCFNPVPLKTDFQTAEKVCASFGGHLASIHNRWDNDALIVSDKFGSYWLGGQDVNSNDMWSWTDGSIFNYNNFGAGGAMAGRNCLLLDGSSALWQAYDCDFKANFICEYNQQQTTTPTPMIGVALSIEPPVALTMAPPMTLPMSQLLRIAYRVSVKKSA
ncbi:hypothetical protein QR680_018632 [Steinernema hermaphroditum]|uniref:C-type lectin domain-containing protein n=1 Tax=Steinernema hermaphroditum TaxID=289476 RepID=A0AA39LRE5_9BILA|nr:hypothetical protein QR680_018632 [Steinernema hermaphroditum]